MIDPAYFRWPIVEDATIEQIGEQIRSGRTSMDEDLWSTFEAELCAYFEVKHALLTCNGTAAAYSCFDALGLGPGDELIGPPFTHWATLLPATQLGCRVVFADIESDSLNLSVDDVARKITPATRAVVVCHMYGNPADLVGLRDLCDRHGLWLVEDVSHAAGAKVAGRRAGSFGHMAFFSMQASKLISGGEGGVLLTHESDWYARALALGHPKRRGQLPQAGRGDISRGFKFRLSPVLARLGFDSFRRLEEQNAIRSEMFHELQRKIADVTGVRFPRQPLDSQRVWWEYDLLLAPELPQPEDVACQLRESGVPSGVAKFDFLPALPMFQQDGLAAADYPHARRLRRRLLLLSPFKKRGYEVLEEYVASLRTSLQAGTTPPCEATTE